MAAGLPNKDGSKIRKPDAERSSGVVFLLFSLAVAIQAYRLDPGRLGGPGPGMTPLLYASVLFVLSLVHVARSHSPIPALFQWRTVVPILSILLLYGLLIEKLGYFPCTFLVMTVLFRMGKTGWAGSVILGLAAAFMIHLVFVRWLAVPLPGGLLFF
jgi:hypothetical protein